MQPSPIQLHEVKFIKVKIEPRVAPTIHIPGQTFEPHRFDNTTFISTIEHGQADQEDPDSPSVSFMVTLELILPDDGENPPPYVIDVKCIGYFGILKAISDDPVKRYDIGVVNGASILYGVLRDLVLNITSRSWYGPLLLPATNFQDDAPSNGKHTSVASATERHAVPAHGAKKARKKTIDKA